MWFVDLTAVMNEADVPGAVATSLGLPLTTGDPTAQIVRYLADKPALIILANCEHLIDACAGFTETFLAGKGPALILATSREAVAVDGEQIVVLSPLTSDSADSPAVRLFIDRATAAEPRFELTASNSETVASICARLDGMPLAIELAAARMTVMNPAELLAGLDNRFQLLSGGRRRQRARTLEATLDWSYDLLDAEDQRVFRALGVFVDGFDIEAVAAVTTLDAGCRVRRRRGTGCEALVDRADMGPRSGSDSSKRSRPTRKTDSSTRARRRPSATGTSTTSIASPPSTAASTLPSYSCRAGCDPTDPTSPLRTDGPPPPISRCGPRNSSWRPPGPSGSTRHGSR